LSIELLLSYYSVEKDYTTLHNFGIKTCVLFDVYSCKVLWSRCWSQFSSKQHCWEIFIKNWMMIAEWWSVGWTSYAWNLMMSHHHLSTSSLMLPTPTRTVSLELVLFS